MYICGIFSAQMRKSFYHLQYDMICANGLYLIWHILLL